MKNYPGVDIFCLNPRSGRQVAIQVKTKRGGTQYYVPESLSPTDPPFVFVYLRPHSHTATARKTDEVVYYIVPAAEVARISAEEREAYVSARPHVKPEQPRMVSVQALERGGFRDRWDLLGLE